MVRCSVCQRRPSLRTIAFGEVTASGISSTNAANPTVMNGRLPMSLSIAATSNHLSNQIYVVKCSTAKKNAYNPTIRRKRASAVKPVIRHTGVIASVMHRYTSVHSPVERVMNSIGFAPSRSVTPNNTMRASGNSIATNTTIFAGATQRGPVATRAPLIWEADDIVQKFFLRSMP